MQTFSSRVREVIRPLMLQENESNMSNAQSLVTYEHRHKKLIYANYFPQIQNNKVRV